MHKNYVYQFLKCIRSYMCLPVSPTLALSLFALRGTIFASPYIFLHLCLSLSLSLSLFWYLSFSLSLSLSLALCRPIYVCVSASPPPRFTSANSYVTNTIRKNSKMPYQLYGWIFLMGRTKCTPQGRYPL